MTLSAVSLLVCQEFCVNLQLQRDLKMKHIVYLMATAMLLLATACNNSNKHEIADTMDTKSKWNGVSVLSENDEATIVGLQDLENEMPVDLFRGSYDDRLLDSLMPDGSTRSAINAYLVVDSTNKVLFDAGLGADKGGQLLERLKAVEINPAEITAVCLTHLHADHIGGLLFDGQAVFTNATIYLSKDEYDAWSDRGPMAAQNTLWKQVTEAYEGRIVTFGDGDSLFDGLAVAELAPGHTPGHTVYQVAGVCLVAGDLLHAQDIQLDYPQFCARYDKDPAQATATRKRVLDGLLESGNYLAGAHCYEHFINLPSRKSLKF